MAPRRWIPRDISDRQLCVVSDNESLSSLDSESESDNDDHDENHRPGRSSRRHKNDKLGRSVPILPSPASPPSHRMSDPIGYLSGGSNHREHHAHHLHAAQPPIAPTPESIEQAQQQLRRLQQQPPKRRNKTDLRKLNRSSPNLGARMQRQMTVPEHTTRPRRHPSSHDDNRPLHYIPPSPLQDSLQRDGLKDVGGSLHSRAQDSLATGSRWGADSAADSCRWSASKSSLATTSNTAATTSDQWSTRPRVPRRHSSRYSLAHTLLVGEGGEEDGAQHEQSKQEVTQPSPDDEEQAQYGTGDNRRHEHEGSPPSRRTSMHGRPQIPRRNQSIRAGFTVETALMAASEPNLLLGADNHDHTASGSGFHAGSHHSVRSPTSQRLFGFNRQVSDPLLVDDPKALRELEKAMSLDNVPALQADPYHCKDNDEELPLDDAAQLQQPTITEGSMEMSLDLSNAVQVVPDEDESHPHDDVAVSSSTFSRSVVSLVDDATRSTAGPQESTKSTSHSRPCVGSCQA